MKKIVFLTTKISDISGGAIYDNYFYNKLLSYYNTAVKAVQDSDFKHSGKGLNFLLFNFFYFMNYSLITDCNILIINSRLYTRFIFLLLLNKLKKKNYRIIIIHHHYNYMTHKGLLKHIHKFFEIGLLKNADQIIIPNPYVIELTKKFKCIKGSIVFLNSSFRGKDFNISKSNSNRILFVGNVEKRKGLLYGIKAFQNFHKINPQYVFNIVGKFDKDSWYFKKIRHYVISHGLENNIMFKGRVSNEELEWYYGNSDFFLFPSLNEGFGWVMIEAMAHGLPVVAFNNTAMPYTVKNEINGLLAKNCDAEDLARCMKKIVSDRPKLEMLKKGAIETYINSSKMEQLDEKIGDFLKKL
jgi:glycosyltransferase involved in cell wall biosynthesis